MSLTARGGEEHIGTHCTIYFYHHWESSTIKLRNQGDRQLTAFIILSGKHVGRTPAVILDHDTEKPQAKQKLRKIWQWSQKCRLHWVSPCWCLHTVFLASCEERLKRMSNKKAMRQKGQMEVDMNGFYASVDLTLPAATVPCYSRGEPSSLILSSP